MISTLWLAGPIVTGQVWLLAAVVWMWLLYYVAARQEEKHFSDTSFRKDYEDYQKRTGMFFPKVVSAFRLSVAGQSRKAA